jgi:hypothetical protein
VGGHVVRLDCRHRTQYWHGLIGWLLQTKALIMIIFANILLDRNFITSETFTALLLMAVASTMITIPLATPQVARLRSIVYRTA